MRFCCVLMTLFLGLVPARVFADPLEMDVIETDELRLLFDETSQGFLAPHVGRSFHNALEFQQDIFDWTPWARTTLQLRDHSDHGNAHGVASPTNFMTVDIAPLSRTYETITASERIFTVVNHEMVNIATMDVWNKADGRWRKFFAGKPAPAQAHPETILYNFLTTPRNNVPRWYLDGSAVFMETWMAGGNGRAMGAYDEMVFRSMVRDDAHFYSALGLLSEGTQIDFQMGANAFLYGTRFMSYLAYEYSPQMVVDWLKRNEGSKRYYSTQFKHVFGKPLTTVWDDWTQWEKAYQRTNLAEVRKFPVTPARPIIDRTLGSVSRSYVSPGRKSLIGAFRYPGVLAHIGELSLENGRMRNLTDIQGPMLYKVASLAYDPKTNRAWYTTDNYGHRDLVEIDIRSGRTQTLQVNARVGELVFSKADRSIWGVQHKGGYAFLVRMDAPYTSLKQIYQLPYGEILYDLDVSPDGQLLAASRGSVNGNQSMHIYRIDELLQGRAEPVAEFDFGTAVPEGFVFSPDGHYLYGSSYYTGVSNIFRFEIATGAIEAVSNAESGFFRPIPMDDGSLIVFEYTGQGFQPKVIEPKVLKDVSAVRFLGNEIVKRHPIVKTWGVGSPTDIDLDAKVTGKGTYRPFTDLKLISAYPMMEGYKDTISVGWHVDLADPLGFNQLDLSASYSVDGTLPDDERIHARLMYQAVNWSFEYWHNGADFYDMFGPTKRARKGDAFIFRYGHPLMQTNLAYYTGLDTIPANQNIDATQPEILVGEVRFGGGETWRSLGAVDHEQGYGWELSASGAKSGEAIIGKLRGGVDFGYPVPWWEHTSIWSYNSAGVSHGSRRNTLSNFYFGAYGNNFVDDGPEKRYRSYYSFPGIEIGEAHAGSFAKTVWELNLPPVRFREVGVPALYLGYVRPAVFSSFMVTDPGAIRERVLNNIGAQLDLQFTLAHRLPMTLSVGYAQGFEKGDKLGEEIMISLKVL